MNIIHKIAAVVIEDNKFLMVRKFDKEIWTSLGGHPEHGESDEEALRREIKEEINCQGKIIRKLGDFEAPAVFDDNAIVRLSTYLVELEGEPKIVDPELEEFKFIGQDYRKEDIILPKSIEDEIIPFCIREGLLKW